MDRSLYRQAFTREDPPEWKCPTCGKGLLTICPNTFHQKQTRESREGQELDYSEPDWIRYRYACLLECNHPKCKEVVASAGTGEVSIDVEFGPDGEPNQFYADFFRPLFFDPPLHIIEVPATCPDAVAEALDRSFRVFWCDPSAAANHLRTAVEELLTALAVKRFALKGGKKLLIGLHARIGLLPPKYGKLKELLLAIKWLGNAASHATQVTADDAMDAYELMEFVMQEIYSPKAKEIKALAAKVNKKKGPLKKKK